jgi:hypothetical protein
MATQMHLLSCMQYTSFTPHTTIHSLILSYSWLQGGPGSSSMFGLFVEIGPVFITVDQKVVPNPHTWNDKYSLLFIDNPVCVRPFSQTPHTCCLFGPHDTNVDSTYCCLLVVCAERNR